jgi:poly(3-hydroxybutyrate) depolymerase
VVVGGSNHSYLLHVPADYDKDRPTPLVLNFHGFMSSWLGCKAPDLFAA